MLILGVETSCDDTCVAVVEASGRLRAGATATKGGLRFRVRANIVSSQVKTHAPYGGVVPSLAAREHARNIAPVFTRALKEGRCPMRSVDLIAVTTHPGLFPALVTGVHAARALAWFFKKPIIGVNHLDGHAASILLPRDRKPQYPRLPSPSARPQRLRLALSGRAQAARPPSADAEGAAGRVGGQANPNIQFPAVGLIVSGGHTQLVLVRKLGKMRVIGETRDDAAGEAFDKIARILGLPYPGGPQIARLAQSAQTDADQTQTNADTSRLRESALSPRVSALRLPRPMINSGDLDFSFSGLKTAVLYLVRDLEKRRAPLPVAAICAEAQQAIVDVLVTKTVRAAKRFRAQNVFLAGGVAANRELRKQLAEALARDIPSIPYTLSPIPYTIDNAAMIAAAGYLNWRRMTPKQRRNATWRRVRARA